MFKRTHHCNELTTANVGQTVTLCGWVNASRNLGGLIFIDLRDREGITQINIDPAARPELAAKAATLHEEYVISVTGIVRARPENMVNAKRATGTIEVEGTDLEILNAAKPMPYNLEDPTASEDIKLKYRYLDMRRCGLLANLRYRHKMTKVIRDVLDENGFIEVDTPILTKSTPEGARDYLVPSRIKPGLFFALPQSPQQYKQLLMVGGVERYFQIARCFRDEDLRADRQPEFTQVDLEMSFVDQDDIIAVSEQMIARTVEAVTGKKVQLPIERMTWDTAMNKYGSDKPDLRFDMAIHDMGAIFQNTAFQAFQKVLADGGVIRAINAKGQAASSSRKVIDGWTEEAKLFGAHGLLWLKVDPDGKLSGSAAKFFNEDETAAMKAELAAEPGDLLLMVADKWSVACAAMGRVRLCVADKAGLIDPSVLRFEWIVDFPMFEWSEEDNKWNAVHHPFTAPNDEGWALLESDPGKVYAKAYDIILNGCELGGGSIRIHQPERQAQIFKALGISDEQARLRFGHLLDAFSFGAPPHGGIALGLDRFVMLLCSAKSIREVIAFPKTAKSFDLLMDAPDTVDKKQLDELHIAIVNDTEDK
ncbi:MAG: aspartate--tRNA ligase [Victivallales bacterium]|nr:aspartate--tRNA ligase [Victivallales bacterium]